MIILVSTSPRRKILLKKIINDFTCVEPLFNEEKISKETKDYSLVLAKNKLNSIKEKYSYNDCLIAADTVILFNNEIIGKPKNKGDAISIISKLNGKTHKVITSYAISYKNVEILKKSTSLVKFNVLSKNEILNYVENNDIMDKAGAYALQDNKKTHLVKSVKGSIYNVIGLPIEKIKNDLAFLKLI